MASETSTKAVNGNYASQQAYDQHVQTQHSNRIDSIASSGAFGGDQANTPSNGHTTSSSANESNSSVPKDEVGWYFVEQYYTTLSKNPEKLHVSYSFSIEVILDCSSADLTC